MLLCVSVVSCGEWGAVTGRRGAVTGRWGAVTGVRGVKGAHSPHNTPQQKIFFFTAPLEEEDLLLHPAWEIGVIGVIGVTDPYHRYRGAWADSQPISPRSLPAY